MMLGSNGSYSINGSISEASESAIITAASRPDKSWGCQDWISWHKELVKVYDQKVSNDLWIKYWNQQSSWDPEYNWCKYNADFYGYFDKQGIEVTHLLARLVGTATKAGEATLQLTEFLANPLFIGGVLLFVTWPYIKPYLNFKK